MSNLNATLTKYANQDLSIARKNGAMTVTHTKLGTLHIEYANGVYKITAQAGMQTMVVCEGKAADARALLVSSYDVAQG